MDMEDMYMVDMDMVEMDMVHMDMMDMGPPSWPSYLTYRPELLPELLIWTTYLTYQGHLPGLPGNFAIFAMFSNLNCNCIFVLIY